MVVTVLQLVVEKIDSYPAPYCADAWQIVDALARCAELTDHWVPVGQLAQWRQESGQGVVWVTYYAAAIDRVIVVDAGRLPIE